MTAWLPFAGVVAGFVVGYVAFAAFKVPGDLASAYAPYLSLATLAGLDTVLGGIRAGIEGRFQDDIAPGDVHVKVLDEPNATGPLGVARDRQELDLGLDRHPANQICEKQHASLQDGDQDDPVLERVRELARQPIDCAGQLGTGDEHPRP